MSTNKKWRSYAEAPPVFLAYIASITITKERGIRFPVMLVRKKIMSMKLIGGGRLKTTVVSIVTVATLSGVAAFVPFVASADLIADLQAQIAALQAQLNALSGGSGGAMSAKCTFTKDLTVGSRGDDVKCLQNWLISAGHLAAGNNTGFFGKFTKAAVAKWQAAAGVSPTAGYFGPKSRAAYNASVGTTTGTTTGSTTTGSTTTGGATTGGATTGTVVTVPAGSGLTVSAPANQPDSTLAPQSAARLAFTKVVLTASADGDITVKSLTVGRQGLGDDAAFSGIVLLDDQGNQIGLAKTLNANHQVVLNEPFKVLAGTSKTYSIAANMAADLSAYAGQVPKLAVVAVDAGTSAVNGSLPIVGNSMTINSSLTLGVATVTRGVTDPGAANSKDVATTAYIFSAVRVTAGSAEDITLKSVRWNQAGSAAASDLANVKVDVDGTKFDVTLSSDGKYYTANFGDGVVVTKGNVKEIAILGDIVSGSNRTVDFDVLRKTDIVVKGNLYGYYLTPTGGTAGAAAAGSLSSNNEPFYNAYAATINKGALLVDKSNVVVGGNVAVNVSNTPLGSFQIEAKGEVIQISNFVLNFTFTGTGTSSNVTAVSLYDENGAVVAGPKDPASGAVTLTDTWNVPVGKHNYTVKGKLSTTFATNDTIAVSTLPTNITAKGQTTGLSITPTPASQVIANTQTVKAAALSVTVSPSPAQQSVVRGLTGFLLAQYQFDATASGEDIRVTSVIVRDTYTGAPGVNDLNTCILYDGATALNTGSNVQNPTLDATSPDDFTFTLDNNLYIPAGTAKVVQLKCTIAGNSVNASTHSLGINSGVTNVVVATGKTTGTSLTPTVTTSTGQVMTITTGGALSVSLDTSAPSARYGIAGKTNVTMTTLKFHATNEAINLVQLALTLSSSTASTSDVVKASLWDGAIEVGEAIFSGTNTRATSTLTGTFTVPKDGDKVLTIAADLATVGVNQPATQGHLIAINYDGQATTSTKGIGQSSGTSINPANGTDTAGQGVRLVKSYPTFTRLSVPSNTLANGQMSLYRFSVSADPAGDIGLYKMTFRVSSTTVATTSLFSLYGYSDSGLSVKAYNNNPLNANDVDCVGSESLKNTANATCVSVGASAHTGTAAANRASSSNVVIYFDPVNNSATVPAREAINVPAGTTRYFDFVGTVSGSVAGDSISTALVGDAAYHVLTSQNFMDMADTVSAQQNPTAAGGSNLIWSDDATGTSATTTNDWINGFLVPGLPSTEMTQQTFSK